MKLNEQIRKEQAIEHLNLLWKMLSITENVLGDTSKETVAARARWNSAQKMFEILTGEKWEAPIE